MTDNSNRYTGPPTVAYSYMNEFTVVCPKCEKAAKVTTNQSLDTTNDRLVCENCNHTEHADELIRYKATVKRACDNCGSSIEKTVLGNTSKVEELTVSCSHCGSIRKYEPKNEKYRLAYKNSGIGDPIFNLPLWFQTDIKGDLFWAFNRQHLSEIRNYVSAELRERQTSTHTTMVEKLPNFIKIAKNRDAVIRAIDKLARK